MNKRTKLILSIVGVCAVLVPAGLLILATSRTKQVPNVPTEERQIDPKNIQNSSSKVAQTPTPQATSSASPKESTKSGSN